MFACDLDAAAAVIGEVRASRRHPGVRQAVLDVTDIVTIARACVSAGADGLSLINTLLGMAIDTRTMRWCWPAASPAGWASTTGRGPVHLAGQAGTFRMSSIIGMGGVRTGRDAFELILAYAAMVSLGTVIFPRSRRVRPEGASSPSLAGPERNGWRMWWGWRIRPSRQAEPGPGPRYTT